MQCEYWRELNALIDFGFWFMGFGWLGGVKAWDMGVGYSFFVHDRYNYYFHAISLNNSAIYERLFLNLRSNRRPITCSERNQNAEGILQLLSTIKHQSIYKPARPKTKERMHSCDDSQPTLPAVVFLLDPISTLPSLLIPLPPLLLSFLSLLLLPLLKPSPEIKLPSPPFLLLSYPFLMRKQP